MISGFLNKALIGSIILNDDLATAINKFLTSISSINIQDVKGFKNNIRVVEEWVGTLDILYTEMEALQSYNSVLLTQETSSISDIQILSELQLVSDLCVKIEDFMTSSILLTQSFEGRQDINLEQKIANLNDILASIQVRSYNHIHLIDSFTNINSILTRLVRDLLEFTSYIVTQLEFESDYADEETIESEIETELEFESDIHMETK